MDKIVVIEAQMLEATLIADELDSTYAQLRLSLSRVIGDISSLVDLSDRLVRVHELLEINNATLLDTKAVWVSILDSMTRLSSQITCKEEKAGVTF